MTIARSFTTSITGIANESVLAFIIAQLIGSSIGLAAAMYITNPKLEANE
jgi:glycerol uptake facilitator-like aquaporin